MDGIKAFLQKDTAGMPNWVWGLVVVAGVAAAIIVPKLLNKNSSTDTSSTDTSGQGLGLAIDPTTGLPYAVEGLVPSGAGAGGSSGTPPPPPTPAPKPIPTPLLPPGPKLKIRARGKDKSTKAGVPLFQAIGSFGHALTHIPFGATVQATGPAVQGPSNQGNTVWYPVTYGGKSGWVSGFDLASAGATIAAPLTTAASEPVQTAPQPAGSMPLLRPVPTTWPGDTTQMRAS